MTKYVLFDVDDQIHYVTPALKLPRRNKQIN